MYDRSKTIGASDAVHLQAGQWAELFDRKQVLPIDENNPPAVPEYGLAAEIGKQLEAFNLELFTRETGLDLLIDPSWQETPIQHRTHEWCKFLPDALLNQPGAQIPVEAKCINMMWKPANLLAKYMPQLQHAMRVVGAPYCYLSVIYLNTRYEQHKIEYDPPYDDALFEKEKLFQWMLETGTRPPQKKGRKWI